VSSTVEFGGWPRPPRWVWAIAGVAAAAALAGLVVVRSWPNGAATSSPSKAPSPATSPVPGSAVPAACGGDAYLPLIHLARRHAGVPATVLVGGPALRQVITGRAVSRPLPGLPDHGRQVTNLVAGPDAVVSASTGLRPVSPTRSTRPATFSACSAAYTTRGR
jgi:hypothetical protein